MIFHLFLFAELLAMKRIGHKPLGIIGRVFDLVPGKERFGVYRLSPFFFFLGAALEFSMINWQVGEINFCEYAACTIQQCITQYNHPQYMDYQPLL